MEHSNNKTSAQLLAQELHLTASEFAQTLGTVEDLIQHVALRTNATHDPSCDSCIQITLYLQHQQDALKRFTRHLLAAIRKHHASGS